MRKITALPLFLLLLVAACGPKSLPPIVDNGRVNEEAKLQQEIVIKDYVDRIQRVDRVSFAVMKANAEICPDTAGSMGLLVKTRDEVHKPYRDAAKFFLNITDRPRIVSIVPGGPAEKAGLKVGDIILTLNGKKCTGYNDVLVAGFSSARVDMTFERDGVESTAMVLPERICAYPVMVMEQPIINAFANGRGILITSGMVKFVKSDDELALVLGHELAHNSMRHMEAKRRNSLLTSFLIDFPVVVFTGVNPGIGNSAGMQMFSEEFEAEADYVGMYHTARAGFDIKGVADMWRRMAAENPDAITHANTHPTTANRFVALEAARDEINRKRAEGKPLQPEMKPQQ